MSDPAANAPASKEHNAVHDDAIWRQLIKYELDWARSWEQKWGFMKTSYGNNEKNGRQTSQISTDPMASGLPSIKGPLATKETYQFGKFDVNERIPEGALDNNSKREYFLLTHQIKKLQVEAGFPSEKYSFPPTRNNEIGWWYTNAAARMKSTKAVKFDRDNLNTLLDVKLGRYNALG